MSRDPGALTVVLALTCPDRAGIVHIPVTQPTKDSSQAELIAVLERTGVELVILAGCMQILSDWLLHVPSGPRHQRQPHRRLQLTTLNQDWKSWIA